MSGWPAPFAWAALMSAKATPTRLTTLADTMIASAAARDESSAVANWRVSPLSLPMTLAATQLTHANAVVSHPASTATCQGERAAATAYTAMPPAEQAATRVR